MKFKILVIVICSFFSFTNNPKELPKVLLIGDSISIGYLPFVQEIMEGKVMVDRIPLKPNGKAENCQGTTNGIANIDRWLGDTKWDVIHFNFGLHDMKHIDPKTAKNSTNSEDPLQANLKQYKKNLKVIVAKLKATGAKLIFATITPYEDVLSTQMRDPKMYEKYNKVALKIMKKNKIPINDLNALVLPQLKEIMRPNNVHFTEDGYKALAFQVAESINENL